MTKIREMQVDQEFQGYYLIKNADVRLAKNGKKFIAFTFQDTTGTVDGKFWDASEEEIARFEPGKVIALQGKREVYNGQPQVKIMHLRLAKIDEPSDATMYMERAPSNGRKWKKKSIKPFLKSSIPIGTGLSVSY